MPNSRDQVPYVGLGTSGCGFGHNGWVGDEKRLWPAWVVGLIVAVVIFAVVLTVFALLGFGDDPGIGS